MVQSSQSKWHWSPLESLKRHRRREFRWDKSPCRANVKLQLFNGEKGVPLFKTLIPAALCGCAWWWWRSLIWNSFCVQDLIVPYNLASKSGEMRTYCNVQAIVLKYIFWATSHLLHLGWFSSRLVHQVCLACPWSCPGMVTIGLLVAENRCLNIHGVPK